MTAKVVVGLKTESKQTGPELLEIAQASVVRLISELGDRVLGHGTAFAYKQVISGKTSRIYFVTNLHNFSGPMKSFGMILQMAAAGAPDEQLMLKSYVELRGVRHNVERIIAYKGALLSRGFSHFQDFAIFSIETEIDEPLPMYALPEMNAAHAGESAYAFGYPTDTELGITEGIVSHVYQDHEKPDFKWQIQHSIMINPGNSGGPTVTPHGVAIGISTWGRIDVNAINFSVNLHHVFEMCRDNDLIEEVSISGIYERFVARAKEEVRYGN